jgi:hypothetical protein
MFLSQQQQAMKSFVRRLMRGYRLHPEVRAAMMIREWSTLRSDSQSYGMS